MGFSKNTFLSVSFCSLLAFPVNGFALSEGEVTASEVLLKNGSRHSVDCVAGEPGLVKERRGQLKFQNYNRLSRNQKKKFDSTGSTKARKKWQLFRQVWSAGLPVCQALSSGDPAPTVTATPNQPVPATYFDFNGSMNEFAKARFQIPLNLDANIVDGQGLFNRYCSGCHIERPRDSFPLMRQIIAGSPMLFSEQEIPDSALADIMAWLLRRRSPAGDGLR
ncbi:MAG: hypothetical protein KDD70_08030 [Bdellovibrionales bacterium]|nr:hypothetical protein [Bdellovibrionales bacterium]